jgi:hypothetical protein
MALIRRGGRRGCSRPLGRRYGCFNLPRVVGAHSVRKAKRKDVVWLARTDAKAKEVEFSEAWDKLSAEAKRYIVLHEQAHLKAGAEHDARFYEVLKKLVKRARVSWEVAYELESYNCHHKS